jgi:hypothetical protein
MEAQNIKSTTEDLTRHIGDYLDTLYKVSLLNVTEKATTITSAAISTIVVCVLGIFVLFFAGIALGWWLGDVVNSRAGGFLIVAGFYLIAGAILILLRKQIIFPYFRNKIIRKVYEQAN